MPTAPKIGQNMIKPHLDDLDGFVPKKTRKTPPTSVPRSACADPF
jgi:hypothetical protein